MENIEHIIKFIKNDIVSSLPFIALVLLVAVYFSIRFVFPQFRLIKATFKALVDSEGDKKGISPFAAFMTALGARIGVGNVAGIATAIATGGPGSIFWIWIFGIFGSAIAIVEGILGQAFKVKEGDEYVGGPAFYIKRGIKNHFISNYLSKIYAIIAVVGFGLLMTGIQCNTVVASIVNGFNVDKTITVIVVAVVITAIIWGGIKRISRLESILTPLKFIIYIGFALAVIVYYHEYLGLVFYYIFTSAFGMNQIFGGMLGAAISMGVRRGIFSTDVCYGPGSIFAAAARCNHPVKQGLLQGLSVLLSTLIVCTATALIILVSGSFEVTTQAGEIVYTAVDFSGLEAGVEWVQHALDGIPFFYGWASKVLAVVIAIFAIGTIIGYYYCLESNIRFLIPNTSKTIIHAAKVVFLISLIVSSIIDSTLVWDITDIGSGILGWINLFVLIVIAPIASDILKDYTKDLRAKITPVFHPEKYGIADDSGAWALD